MSDDPRGLSSLPRLSEPVVTNRLRSHVFCVSGSQQCWCGLHHYICSECGVDCTSGTSAGPATTATDNVTRCDACYRKYARLIGALSPSTSAEAAVIETALGALVRDRTFPAADIRTAAEILARAANARPATEVK